MSVANEADSRTNRTGPTTPRNKKREGDRERMGLTGEIGGWYATSSGYERRGGRLSKWRRRPSGRER